MKTPKSLYSRLALITSVTLVVGYFVVYAAWSSLTVEEVWPGAIITNGLMTKIKDNFDYLNTQVSNFSFSSGNVGIGIVPTNGNGALQVKDGVAFPATQVPIVNPNTLDDYEEGTWTPSLWGYTTLGTFTPTNQSGFYIKIGRKVTVWFRVSGTVSGASTDYLTVNGLPFTNSNDVGRSESGGSISYLSGLDMGATGRGWFMYPIINSTKALVGVFTQNASVWVNPNATIHLYGTITYYTAN